MSVPATAMRVPTSDSGVVMSFSASDSSVAGLFWYCMPTIVSPAPSMFERATPSPPEMFISAAPLTVWASPATFGPPRPNVMSSPSAS